MFTCSRFLLALIALFAGALAGYCQDTASTPNNDDLRERLQRTYDEVQQARAEREEVMRDVLNVALTGAAGIIVLLLILYRQQSRANRRLAGLNQQLAKQHVALSKANAELERLNREMNEVLSVVSHDLKSPLAGIEGLSRELRESLSEEDPAKASMMEMIENAARQMYSLVGNVLDLQRIEAGHAGLRSETVDLAATAREIVREQDFALRQKRQSVVFSGDAEALAMGDECAVRRITSNLLSNASKYSPFGTRIEVTVRGGDSPTLSITDVGPGISEQDQERLFEKFCRLTARPTGGETSTGLGLAICRSLVDAMGGSIWCKSTLGHGATFSFSLPAGGERKAAVALETGASSNGNSSKQD